jgi:hypothetical protein
VVVRDITDIAHPRTAATLPSNARTPVFVNATTVSYVLHAEGTATDRLLKTTPPGSPTTVVTVPTGIILYAWSPDGRTVAFLTNIGDNSQLHLVSSAGERVADTMPGIVGGCETLLCAYRMDLRLSYSPDGRFISLVQSFGGPNFRVWTSDGRVLTLERSGITFSMATWSGSRLYFNYGDSGVSAWENEKITQYMPQLSWIRPKGSPKGGQVVFRSDKGDGSEGVYLLTIASVEVRELKAARSEPVYLTWRYLWYESEPPCVDICEGIITTPSKTYVYDLQTGVESSSIITKVYDVWPHAA